jgi:hypothetical protein
MLEYLKARQSETKVGELDMIQAIWLAIMDSVDWTAKPELLDSLVVKQANVSWPSNIQASVKIKSVRNSSTQIFPAQY